MKEHQDGFEENYHTESKEVADAGYGSKELRADGR